MGLFDGFPFTNMHQLNLDWIIRTVKKTEEKADSASTTAGSAAVQAASAEAKADTALAASWNFNLKLNKPGVPPESVKLPGLTMGGRQLYAVTYYTEYVAENGDYIEWTLPDDVIDNDIVYMAGVYYDDDQSACLIIGQEHFTDYSFGVSAHGLKVRLTTYGDPINPVEAYIHIVYMGGRV